MPPGSAMARKPVTTWRLRSDVFFVPFYFGGEKVDLFHPVKVENDVYMLDIFV